MGLCSSGRNAIKAESLGRVKIPIKRPENEDHMEEIDVALGMILKRILKKWGFRMWSELTWLTIEVSGRFLSTR